MNHKHQNNIFKIVLLAVCAIALAALAAAAEEGDVVVISKSDKLPNEKVTDNDMARIGPLLEALHDGHRLRLEFVTVSKAITGYEFDVRYLQRVTTTDARGRPDGLERDYRDWHRHCSREATYKNGAPDGTEKLYDVDSGKLTAEIPWANGIIHGVKRIFHPNGQLANETTYDNGQIRGASRSFDAEGRPIRAVTFADGQRDGDMTDYWSEKPEQVKQVVPYRKGVVEGVAKAFYLNGKPKWERPFKDNRQHGIERQYDGDGKIEKTVYWLNGNQVSEAEYRKTTGGDK